MNLVAKEYCACCVDKDDGVLILSQFAGAAEQLKPGAVLVNPYDVEQVADAIFKVFRMSDAERSARMKRMRRVVRNEDVFWWVNSFLKAGSQLATRFAQTASRRRAGNANQTKRPLQAGRTAGVRMRIIHRSC
jgi:trehalose-6-phosphate synthase